MTIPLGAANVELGVGTSGIDAGVAAAATKIKSLEKVGVDAGKEASAGIGKIGDAAGTAADKAIAASARATTSAVNAAKRALAEVSTFGQGTAARLEKQFELSGKVDINQVKPWIAQLREAEKQAEAYARAHGKVGLSAKETAFALRGVPAQFTDIAVSLQGGQNPLTVFLQQGGQLKDMFGGIGPAAKALGGYILGLVNPLMVSAAAVGGLAYAYNVGSKENDAYVKSLVMTGGAAGVTAAGLAAMAASLSETSGVTQGAAAEAIAALSGTGRVAADSMNSAAEAAIRMEKFAGVAISETVKQFAELGKSPVQASLKLNEGTNYLTAAVYLQIKALEEQGKSSEAAALAQGAWADSLKDRTGEIEKNLGAIERAWNGVGGAAKSAWNFMLDVGRPDDALNDEIARAENRVNFLLSEIKNFGVDNKPALESAQAELAGLKDQKKAVDDVAEAKKKSNEANNAAISLHDQAAKALGKDEAKQRDMIKLAAEYELAMSKAGISAAETAKINESFLTKSAQILGDPEKASKKGVGSRSEALRKEGESIKAHIAVLGAQEGAEAKLTESQKKLVEMAANYKKELTAQDEALQQANIALYAQAAGEELAAVAEKESAKAKAEAAKTVAAAQSESAKAIDKATTSSAEYIKQLQFENSLLGLSALEVRKRTDARRIDLELEKELMALRNNDKFKSRDTNPEVDSAYQAAVKSAQDAAAATKAGAEIEIEARDRVTRSWEYGSSEAIRKYNDQVSNSAAQAEALYSKAFKGAEDAITKFAMTGKLSVRGLADTILSEYYRIKVAQPLVKAGSGLLDSLFGSLFGSSPDPTYKAGFSAEQLAGPIMASATGNVVSGPGISAHSNSIVNKPTIFPFARGMGLMGEAGPEAIMPLARINGKLGVQAQGGGAPNVIVNVVNQSGQNVNAKQQGEPQFDGRDWVLGIVLEAADSNPSFRGAMGMA